MHKQDTARLNANALAQRITAGGLKQWWIARQIEVDTKTVNRWLTGKVKRISRDNLAKLSSLLGCSNEEISFADEGDIRATRTEQDAASRALLDMQTKRLFERHEDYHLYENLLKATMHPDMTISQLCDVYKQLMWLAAKQNKLEEAQRYGELALEYASRAGQTRGEMAARNNLIILDAQSGKIVEATQKLEQHLAFCDSVGEKRGIGAASINIAHSYRLLADFHRAIKAINRAFEVFSTEPPPSPYFMCEVNASNIARDLGWTKLSQELMSAAYTRSDVQENERMNAEMLLYLAELDSLSGDPSDAARRATPLVRELARFTSFGQTFYIASAGIFRRAGHFDEAQQQTEQGFSAEFTRNYEHPFLHEEQARIAAARGDWRAARTLRRKANALFTEFGMALRAIDDPALDVGQIFTPPARLRIKHWGLTAATGQPQGPSNI